MEEVALLRGVTSVGQNRIPEMTYLAEILTEVDLENVKTYIQSGNITFKAALSDDDVCALIHDTIQAEIGTDLSVILRMQAQLTTALAESPFDESYDSLHVHLVLINDQPNQRILNELLETDFDAEVLKADSECLYLYLSREAKKKRLNTNYLERQLHTTATTQKRRSIL